MASDLVYSPPGVYINEDSLPVPNLGPLVALPPSRLALVGPSVGYQTYTDTVTLAGTTPVTLTQTGIDDTSVVVKSLAGVTFSGTTDYTVAQTGSPDEEAVTTVVRQGGGTISDGQIVYVTYNYTNSAFYLPYVSSDFDQIQSRYGAAFDPDTGAVGSPMTLAAKLALEQGCREVMLLPTKGSTTSLVSAAQLAAAYVYLEAREDVGIIVPLTVGITGTDGIPGETTTAATGLQTHVETISADGHYRRGIYGLDKGASRDHAAIASSLGSSRMMVVYPNVLNYYNGYLNKTIELDGYYLAAAIGGMISARNPQEPMTRKTVRSFSSIPSRVAATMTVTAKNALSQGGVAVVEQTADSRLVIRHGVTTDTTTVTTREASIISAKDTLLRLIFQSLDKSGLIGSPISDESPVRVRSIVEGALARGVSIGLIQQYANLKVRQNESDVTAIDVKFSYIPSFPMNFVTVGFTIDVTTGTTTEV